MSDHARVWKQNLWNPIISYHVISYVNMYIYTYVRIFTISGQNLPATSGQVACFQSNEVVQISKNNQSISRLQRTPSSYSKPFCETGRGCDLKASGQPTLNCLITSAYPRMPKNNELAWKIMKSHWAISCPLHFCSASSFCIFNAGEGGRWYELPKWLKSSPWKLYVVWNWRNTGCAAVTSATRQEHTLRHMCCAKLCKVFLNETLHFVRLGVGHERFAQHTFWSTASLENGWSRVRWM